jgi:hypothetical protein
VLAPVDVDGVFAAETSALGGIVDQLRWLGWAKGYYVLEMLRSTINTTMIWQTRGFVNGLLIIAVAECWDADYQIYSGSRK